MRSGSIREPQNKLLVEANRLGNLCFRDPLFIGMCNVDTSRANQKRLSPSATERLDIGSERDNSGGESVQRAKMHRRNKQDFPSIRLSSGSPGNCASLIVRVADDANENLRPGLIRNHVRRAPSTNCSYIERTGAEHFICRQFDLADTLEDIQKFLNRGVTQFGVSGMSHSSLSLNFEAKRTLRPECKFVFGWFPVDQKFASARIARSNQSPRTVALFSHHEQQSKIAPPCLEELLRGRNHSRDNAFRVAGPAAPDKLLI